MRLGLKVAVVTRKGWEWTKRAGFSISHMPSGERPKGLLVLTEATRVHGKNFYVYYQSVVSGYDLCSCEPHGIDLPNPPRALH